MAEQDYSSYGTRRSSYGGLEDTGIHWQEASRKGVTVVRLRPLSVSTLRSFGSASGHVGRRLSFRLSYASP